MRLTNLWIPSIRQCETDPFAQPLGVDLQPQWPVEMVEAAPTNIEIMQTDSIQPSHLEVLHQKGGVVLRFSNPTTYLLLLGTAPHLEVSVFGSTFVAHVHHAPRWDAQEGLPT